ncbi:metallophosphoesterase family protein [Crenothrix sp.]|uniref:metallophosphoesterase family protein n=1 Tax=Crenothrix sp. TaxID=3100433 RepID=UPI00374DC9A9
MSVILHVSDPHFGTEQPDVVKALITLAHQQQPDLVILSGDITQRARNSQFRKARDFVDALKAPANLVIAGNHDIPLFNLPMRIFWPYFNYSRRFGVNLEPVFKSQDLLVIAVKTTRRYRHINGEISAVQVGRVNQLLNQAQPAQLRIVVAHHPVYVTHLEDEVNVMRGRKLALANWAKAGADLILGGHIHLPFIVPLHHKFSEFDQRMWAVQAGTGVSSRTRQNIDNSVNIIRYHRLKEPRSCDIERWDYNRHTSMFLCVSSETLVLEPILSI